jgi:hypothetical protein
MKLSYNVTGTERKSLVGAISQELNSPTNYLGAPSFAYEVGGYHIDKTSTVTGPDNLELEDVFNQLGFNAQPREYDGPGARDSGQGRKDAADRPNADDDGSCRLIIEMPLDGFTPEKLDNLTKLVSAKAPLLKTALGADDLPIQQTADSLRFPWFADGLDADTVKAYTELIAMICAAAKAKHRVTAHEKNPANKKYAMRCWLLSLGFIGDEYKTSRKILLSKLDGNSSFKNGAPPKAAASGEARQ